MKVIFMTPNPQVMLSQAFQFAACCAARSNVFPGWPGRLTQINFEELHASQAPLPSGEPDAGQDRDAHGGKQHSRDIADRLDRDFRRGSDAKKDCGNVREQHPCRCSSHDRNEITESRRERHGRELRFVADFPDCDNQGRYEKRFQTD
jgi:hypothetical protein